MRSFNSWGCGGPAAGSHATVVTALAAIVVLGATTAEAQTSWNFQLSNGGWVQTGTNPSSPFLNAVHRWMWTGTTTPSPMTGGTSPHWHVLAQPVQSGFPTGYFLTSPVFSGLVDDGTGTLVPAQNARISIAHNFLLLSGTSGRPITLGQVEYRLNNAGPWLGLPDGAFTDGGSVLDLNIPFGFSPFRAGPSAIKLVNQEAFVAPTYLTPTGSAALPFVAPDALAFSGSTPSWPGDYYVPSQAFLNVNTGLPSQGITSLQLRFANVNLSSECGTSGWNVRFAQVDFSTIVIPVPEPGTIALGLTGMVALAAAAGLRAVRHQRPSSPSESP